MSNFVGMSKTGTLLNRKSICVYDSAIMSYTFPLRMIPMQSGKSTNLLVSGALVGVGGGGGRGRQGEWLLPLYQPPQLLPPNDSKNKSINSS